MNGMNKAQQQESLLVTQQHLAAGGKFYNKKEDHLRAGKRWQLWQMQRNEKHTKGDYLQSQGTDVHVNGCSCSKLSSFLHLGEGVFHCFKLKRIGEDAIQHTHDTVALRVMDNFRTTSIYLLILFYFIILCEKSCNVFRLHNFVQMTC